VRQSPSLAYAHAALVCRDVAYEMTVRQENAKHQMIMIMGQHTAAWALAQENGDAWWSRLYFITELENRSNCGEQLNSYQLAFMLSKPEVQLQVDACTAAQDIRSQVVPLSLTADGCRKVQRVFDSTTEAQWQQSRRWLVEELHGSVLRLVDSPHGNHVLKKLLLVEELPNLLVAFIPQELGGHAFQVACSDYGCRILSRLLDNHMHVSVAIVDELLVSRHSICALSCDKFGHHIMDSVVRHGSQGHRRLIVEALLPDLWGNSTDRSASYVIKAILSQSGTPEQSHVAQVLLNWRLQGLASLKRNQWGKHVWTALREWRRQQSQATIASFNLDARTLRQLN